MSNRMRARLMKSSRVVSRLVMTAGLLGALSTSALAQSTQLVADFNGDGFTDLAIGSPGAAGRGTVSIFYGRRGGFNTSTVTPSEVIFGRVDSSGFRSEEYGFALAAADFDADGRAELVVGAPSWLGGAGRIEVLRYNASRGEHGPAFLATSYHQATPGIADDPEPGDWFGRSLAAGDFDGDGFPDLAIGVPAEDLEGVFNAGAVHVLFGGYSGLSVVGSEFWHQRSSGILDDLEPDDQFGSALAAGDINGDTYDDLAVGVPLENHTLVDQGAVNVIFGSWTGLTRDGDHFLTVGTTPAFSHGQLGYALAAGDINGDGYADLAIGAPIGLNGEGFVAVTYGGPGGPGALFVHRQIVDPPETGDLLGYAVAIGDFNNDGFGDVAAGAPGEDLSGLVNAGAVSVFYGQAGFALNRQEIWHQNSHGVDDSIDASDFFGLSLAVGDYNSDGFADLAIGVPHEDRGGFVDAGLMNVIIGLPTGLSGGADYLLVPDERQTNARFGRSVR